MCLAKTHKKAPVIVKGAENAESVSIFTSAGFIWLFYRHLVIYPKDMIFLLECQPLHVKPRWFIL